MEPSGTDQVQPTSLLPSLLEGELCDDPYCRKSGRYRVTCYVCARVYHTGCVSIPDLHHKTFRCPDCFGKSPRKEDIINKRRRSRFKVRCDVCRRVFHYYDVRDIKLESFLCTSCYSRQQPIGRGSPPEPSTPLSQPVEEETATSNPRKRSRCRVGCDVCRKVFHFEKVRSMDFQRFLCLECYLFKKSSVQNSTKAAED